MPNPMGSPFRIRLMVISRRRGVGVPAGPRAKELVHDTPDTAAKPFAFARFRIVRRPRRENIPGKGSSYDLHKRRVIGQRDDRMPPILVEPDHEMRRSRGRIEHRDADDPALLVEEYHRHAALN